MAGETVVVTRKSPRSDGCRNHLGLTSSLQPPSWLHPFYLEALPSTILIFHQSLPFPIILTSVLDGPPWRLVSIGRQVSTRPC
jgi:hypothetical protein